MFGNAEAYERFMGRWSHLLAPLLVDFADVPDRGRVLDIGSGTGVLALSIAGLKVHCQVLGIDPSKEYVEYAQSKNSLPGRVSFEAGEAGKLRFSDATFQASLSLLAFDFIPENGKALGEVTPGDAAGRPRLGSRLGLRSGHADAAGVLGCRRCGRSGCREARRVAHAAVPCR
jgi:SAM-dependent methyltransferase